MTPEELFAETSVASPTLVPELKLHLLTADSPSWHATDPDALGWPYWAVAWPGGQVLARYVLDHPELVRGRRVLSFGSGGGLEAIAAARAGAASVRCADLDPFANEIAARNAALNGVTLSFTHEQLLGQPLTDVDVVLAGDVTFEQAFAARALAWFRGLGCDVLLGDALRVSLDGPLEVLAHARAPFDGDVRALTTWNVRVLRVRRASFQSE